MLGGDPLGFKSAFHLLLLFLPSRLTETILGPATFWTFWEAVGEFVLATTRLEGSRTVVAKLWRPTLPPTYLLAMRRQTALGFVSSRMVAHSFKRS